MKIVDEVFYVCMRPAQRKHQAGSGSGRHSAKRQYLLLCLVVSDKWVILLSGWLRLYVNIIQGGPKGMQHRMLFQLSSLDVIK